MEHLEKLKAAMTAQMSGDLFRRRSRYSFADVIGHSRAIQQAVEIAERVSLRDGKVLLVASDLAVTVTEIAEGRSPMLNGFGQHRFGGLL